MDRLEAMATFVAVCDANGFAPAARRLGVSPSVVTRHVAALEEGVAGLQRAIGPQPGLHLRRERLELGQRRVGARCRDRVAGRRLCRERDQTQAEPGRQHEQPSHAKGSPEVQLH